MSIAFYISGHGFGHASRQVEVINRLGPGHRILIRSAVSPGLLARTLRVPYTLMPGASDTGIAQSSSINHDDAATVRAAAEFYRSYAARVEADAALLRPEGVRLIVSDIPPLAFSVASLLDVRSIALANFTWDWIYEAHPGFPEGAAWVLESIRAAYRQASRALELPFGGGFGIFSRVERLPLVARRPSRSRAATRAHFGLPAQGRVALLSFGGYGMPALDPAHTDLGRDWTIVTTDRTTAPRDGSSGSTVFVTEASLAGDFRYEDLVGAVDVVMTKPGYGIIAECIASGTPMLYTSRGAFREYDLLVSSMPRVLRCRFISQAHLFGGQWREALEGVLSQPDPPEQMAVNGADVAAAILDGELDAS